MAMLVRWGLPPYVSFSACLYLALASCDSSGMQDSQPAAQADREPVSVERRREILNSRVPPKTIPASPPASSGQQATGTGEVPGLLMAIFKEDLVQRALVKLDAISVVSAVQTTWPDGSLGCGRPGQVNTQAVVRGYRVVLSANATQYAYHSDLRGSFVVCQQGRALPALERQVQQPLDR